MAQTPVAHTPAAPSARSRRPGAATPHPERAAVGGEAEAPPSHASALDSADVETETVAVEFGADGTPLGVGAVPARSRAYWRQADL